MLNVILIGPQGSGKGTQAEMIVKEYGLKHIEMGSMIRERAQLHDKKSEIIDHLANKRGMLLPDGVVLDMLYDELTEHESEKGYLFDGFPRTVKQYQSLKEYFKEKRSKLDVALYLNISDEEAVRRLAARQICKICQKGYSQLLEPEKKICDCGGELIRRPDDEPQAILKRLAAFHEITTPVLDIMRQDGLLREINGEQSINKISEDIRKQFLKNQLYVKIKSI